MTYAKNTYTYKYHTLYLYVGLIYLPNWCSTFPVLENQSTHVIGDYEPKHHFIQTF